MKMLDNGLIPRSFLLIVLATGLQLMGAAAGSRERSSRADAWADESRSLVVLDVFARISTTNLQTLLLLQRYEWHCGVHLAACTWGRGSCPGLHTGWRTRCSCTWSRRTFVERTQR